MKDKIVFIKTEKIDLFRYKNNFYVVNEKSLKEFKTRLLLPYEAKFIGYSYFDVIKIIYTLYDKEMSVSIKELNKDNLHYIAHFSKVKEKEI